MRLAEEGTIPRPEDVMAFFIDFETERRAGATELADLRITVLGIAADEQLAEEALELPAIKPDMLTYLNAFSREGATKDNVAIRAEVMASRLRQRLRDV